MNLNKTAVVIGIWVVGMFLPASAVALDCQAYGKLAEIFAESRDNVTSMGKTRELAEEQCQGFPECESAARRMILNIYDSNASRETLRARYQQICQNAQ